MNPMALVTEKTEFVNRLGGRIGSLARRSTATKATSKATPATPRTTMGAEPQAYCVPPQVVTRMIAVTPRASSAAPR